MSAQAAAIWSFRVRAEREASRRFARLTAQLREAGAHPEVVRLASEAAIDELRHAELCGELVAHFGSAAPKGPTSEAPEVAPAGLAAQDALLYEVVAMSCVTETLSAALLGEMTERSTDAKVRETVRSILRDEVRHAQLGWAYLASLPRGAAGFIAPHLPAMLAGTVSEELFSAGEDRAAPGLGALDRGERLRIFTGVMRDVVFPGLERFGVSTEHGCRWLEQRLH